MKLIFFISIGRCGTQAVAEQFGLLHEPDNAHPSIPRLRMRIRQAEKEGQTYYGETSNFWRLKLGQLMEKYPEATYIHLIRNGRDSVKSLQVRDLYTDVLGLAPHNYIQLPVKGWNSLTRFEKLCHYWRHWNELIEKRVKSRVRLEDIQHIIERKNAGDPHKPWTKEEEETFNRICGDLSKHYGYEE